MLTRSIQPLALLVVGAFLIAGCPAEEGGARDGGAAAPDADIDHDEGDEPQDDEDDEDDEDPDAGAAGPGQPTSHADAGSGSHDDPDPPDNSNPPDQPSTEADRFFLPTPEPENTRAPELVTDAQGNLHAVYPAYAGGGAFYAFCDEDCDSPDAMQVVALPTEGTVLNAMLAVTRGGKPRVLLSTALYLMWAECDEACTDAANWQTAIILDHAGAREVTGNALALDVQDRPRFVMHTYLALLGIGQKAPETLYAQCDDGCADPASWRYDTIQDQIWHSSQLAFDDQGRAHLATLAVEFESGVPGAKQAAYAVCEDGACTSAASWSGIVFVPAYESTTAEIAPSIALALSADGGPRLALLAKGEGEGKQLMYYECDAGCAENNWRGALLSESDGLGSGLDIELTRAGAPRIAFTLGGNIGVYHCEAADCTALSATWDLTKVEFASDLPNDTIILWPNCNVDVWTLLDPSLVLAADGSARVGYQATDNSGGGTYEPDPTKPRCQAGKDMTLARMALLPAL